MNPDLDAQTLKRLMGIPSDARDRGREILAHLGARRGDVVEAFYAELRGHAEALAVFRGGEAQIERQRGSLDAWLAASLDTERDADHVARCRRIGEVHLEAGVDEALMLAGGTWLGAAFGRLLDELGPPPGRGLADTREFFERIVAFDLVLALQAYAERLQDRVSRLDRLALIGRFSATVSHELKNPLGVLATSLHLLRGHLDPAADPKVARHLDRMERSVDRARSIVTSLLDLVRLKEPARRPVDLAKFVAAAIEAVAPPAEITVTCRGDEGGQPGYFDPTQMRLALENLLRNAVEALDGGGRIEIRWRTDTFATALRVADDGPGIPEDQRLRVFEPLHSGKPFGTGLGLTLTRSVVEAHGGEVGIHPGLDGRGVAFEIHLPHFALPGVRATRDLDE
ncbi:MAG: ATP-binding protein [Planctomycetota bacterium]